MKKETVVRQNRCDHEMNLLLFGCFFFFMAIRLFLGDAQQSGLIGRIDKILYLVFAPGFIFRLGYCFNRTARLKSGGRGKQLLLLGALRYYVYYFVLAFGQEVVQSGHSLRQSFSDVLAFITVPSVSAVFFTMALMLLIVRVFYEKLGSMAAYPKRMLVVGAAVLLCAFLRMNQEGYSVAAAFVGSTVCVAVPGIPYFAFFLLGMWFEEKKPGFQWEIALTAAAVTAASVLLARTPLHHLCVIMVSALPVYLVYAVAEGLSDLTLRFVPARFVCETVEPVFWVYTVLIFALDHTGKISAEKPYMVFLAAAAVLALIYAAILGFLVFSKVYGMLAEYFREKVRRKTAAYFVIYTFAFAILLFLTFIDFIRFDRTLLWSQDGIPQYYPRAVYFAKYIREFFSNLFSGNFSLPMYDFSLGMGAEVTYSLEPLYFLFALFGEERTELAYNVITLLRFYFAGITSSIFFLYFKKDYFTTFIASVVYVFCGFSLFGGARHTMFMIPMIMLPLLIIAIEEILRNKRWYLCTVFVAVSLFSNYYYLYMNTIAMGIYFLVRFFCQKEKEKKTFGKFMVNGLVISGSYLLGVAMSCIVLVTTFGLYVGSGRSGGALIKTPSLWYYKPEWLLRCFLGFLTTANSPGEWLKLGFLPIAFLAVVFMFTRKGRKELKIMSVIALIMMAFPVFAFIFSGFSAVINRWCYMIALLVAYIVADCLPDMYQMKKKEAAACAAASLVYGYLAFCGHYMVTRFTKIAFICLAATFVVVLICHDGVKKIPQRMKQSLLILLTFALVMYSGHSLFSMDGVVKEYAVPGAAQSKLEDTPLRACGEIEDDSFYRIATPKLEYSTISSSLVLGFNGITMATSTYNGSIMEYLEKMGGTSYSIIQLMGLSNRTFMSALAAVKYCAYYEEPERPLPYGFEEVLRTEVNGKETVVCENKYALPLGYTYRDSISEEELEQFDVVERQEVMMQKVLINSSEPTGNTDVDITSERLDIISSEERGIEISDHAFTAEKNEEGEYRADLYFESKPNSETYLVLKDAVYKGNMSEKSINIAFYTEGSRVVYKFRPDDDRYGSGQQDYVFNLGYHEEPITSCEIVMDRAGTIDFGSLEMYSQSMDHMEQYVDGLTEDVLEDVKIGTNKVSGSISLDEDKILVLSIPYQNGWTAYVDGEKVDLERANYMYMALPLTAGEHSVELTFAIPGVKYALVIMPGAVLLFIVLCFIRRIRYRHVRQKEKTIRKQ